MMIPDIEGPITLETLKRIHVAMEMCIPLALLDNQKLEVVLGNRTRELIMMISGYIWARDKPLKILEYKWPASWWQAFKEETRERWCSYRKLRWFTFRPLHFVIHKVVHKIVKRWPVKWTKQVINVEVFYPEFRPPAGFNQPYALALMPEYNKEF